VKNDLKDKIMNNFCYSIFTKPFRELSISQLGAIVKKMGFNAIEFPLRNGYQVDPLNAEKELPILAKQLQSDGIKITSVASSTEENIFAACAKAEVPLIRIMLGFDIETESYTEAEIRWKEYLTRCLSLCQKYGVKIGVQHHYGAMVSTSMELKHLLEGFDTSYIGGIWDAAHSGLAGEEPEQALDIVWEHLLLVNFKTAYYKHISGLEAAHPVFSRYFTTGPNAMFDWERIIKYLHKRGYQGNICLPAEYTDEDRVIEHATKDLQYLKNLVRKYYK
jgi:sugar phosphate isomerase/epimerase